MTDSTNTGRMNMSTNSLFIGLTLAVFTVHCAVLKDDISLKRNPRSPCESCVNFPPPPPLAFKTHQWSGLARSKDNSQQGVFSGAAASLGGDTQAAGEAYSLASAGATAGAVTGAAADSNGGLSQRSGYGGGITHSGGGSYKESHFGYESHGGKSFGSNNAGGAGYGGNSGFHDYGRLEGNDQQKVPIRASIGSGPIAQSGANSGNGGQVGQSNGGYSNGGGSESSFSGSRSSAGNDQGYSNSGGSSSSYGARGDLGGAQQQDQSGFGSHFGAKSGAYSGSNSHGGNYGRQINGFHGHQQGRYHGGGSHRSNGAGSYGQSGAYQTGSRGFEGNQQQQVELSNQGTSAYSGQSGTGGNEATSAKESTQETLNDALNLASQGLQTANQAGAGCTTCGKSSYALSNAKSHSGNAVALSIGG